MNGSNWVLDCVRAQLRVTKGEGKFPLCVDLKKLRRKFRQDYAWLSALKHKKALPDTGEQPRRQQLLQTLIKELLRYLIV